MKPLFKSERMEGINRVGVCLLLFMFLTFGKVTVGVAQERDAEYQIKLAFLLNFAKFAQWPETKLNSSDASIKFCIFGDNPFGAATQSLSDKNVQSHSIEVMEVADSEYLQLPECHLVFVEDGNSDHFATIAKKINLSGVLTVTERSGLGILNFMLVDGKIRFEAVPERARNLAISLSSQLLKLAIINGGD